jgi:hypothetical protein
MSRVLRFPYDGKYIELGANSSGLFIRVDGGAEKSINTENPPVETLDRAAYDALTTPDSDTIYFVQEP